MESHTASLTFKSAEEVLSYTEVLLHCHYREHPHWEHHHLVWELQFWGPQIPREGDDFCWTDHQVSTSQPAYLLHQVLQDQSRKDFKGSHTTQQQTVLGTVVWKTPPQPHGQGWDEALNEELLSSSHQNTELITMNTLQLTFSLTHTTTCLPQIPYIHRYIHTYSYVYFCMLLFCLHSP